MNTSNVVKIRPILFFADVKTSVNGNMVEYFRENGFQVLYAQEFNDAVEFIEKGEICIDLIIINAIFGDAGKMLGVELLNKIKSKHKNTPTFLIHNMCSSMSKESLEKICPNLIVVNWPALPSDILNAYKVNTPHLGKGKHFSILV